MNLHLRAYDVVGGVGIVIIGMLIIFFAIVSPIIGDEIILIPIGAGLIGWGGRDIKNGFKAPAEYYEEK